jgi:hypothetical protein
LAAGAQSPLQATITIAASKPAGYTIPQTIFRTFLEPIGNSIYGGLWAEFRENPSFETNVWNAGTIQKDANRRQIRSIGVNNTKTSRAFATRIGVLVFLALPPTVSVVARSLGIARMDRSRQSSSQAPAAQLAGQIDRLAAKR